MVSTWSVWAGRYIMIKEVLFFCVLFLLMVSYGCNKVSETPEPDAFLHLKLTEIVNQTDSTGSFAIDVIGENDIKDQVTVRFSSPKLGHIAPKTSTHHFIYQAFDEAAGIDSFDYFVERGGITKTGKIRLTVTTLPCIPVYCGSPSYSIPQIIADTIIFIPFDPRDHYCKKKVIAIGSENINTRFSFVSLNDDGFYIRPRGVLKSSGHYTLNYSVSHQGNARILKSVSFDLIKTNQYCDNIFEVDSYSFPFRKHATSYHLVNQRQIKHLATFCEGELVFVKNWFFPNGPNVEYITPDSSIVKITKGTGSTFTYGFRYENIRQKADTGYATIVWE